MRKGLAFLMGLCVTFGFSQSTRVVDVGPNFSMTFRDTYSGTNITVIDQGDSVRWEWRTGFHTTTSYDELWNAEISSSNRTFTYQFNNIGTYSYYCIPHEIMGMVGEVRVRLPGDVDFSGCIDDADLLAVLFAFGSTGARNEDVNYDGVVDDADLLSVLFQFGTGC